jgi:hypothetical protein
MNNQKLMNDCQIKDKHLISDGKQEPVPIGKSVKLFIRKILGPRTVRAIKQSANNWLNWYARYRDKSIKPSSPPNKTLTVLNAGDQVLVRSEYDIKATLNHWGQLRGCSFAKEMLQYCGSTQRVIKSVERFVDERDLRIRKAKGIVLLEGAICHGTETLGRCDRNCYYFWRVEWLEKVEGTQIDTGAL